MAYTHTTFAQAKTQLAELLGDPTKTFWVDAELGRYIVEALRAWGLYSEYWVEDDFFDTTAGECFYPIQTALGNSSQTFTVTDREIISDMLYQLMETQITVWAGGWVGTEMFSLNEIVDLLDNSRATYLKETAQIVAVVSQGQGALNEQVPLGEQTVFVRRASWQIAGDTLRRPLWPIDIHQQETTSMSAVRPAPATPKSYILYQQPVLTFDLSPVPDIPGTLRMLNCLSGSALDPVAGATTISLPDDCSWLLRYKVLADLLAGDGLSRAPQMAQYCEDRWRSGLEAVRRYHSIFRALPQGRQTPPTSLAQRDFTSPRWETLSPGAPKRVALPAWNMAVVAPSPDAAYRIPVDVVTKAPLPTVDGDFLQIAPAHMQAIYDYAQHVACFKMQGSEFAATFPLLEYFLSQAEEYRETMAGVAPTYWELERMGPWQEKGWRPVWSSLPVAESRAEAAAAGPKGGA